MSDNNPSGRGGDFKHNHIIPVSVTAPSCSKLLNTGLTIFAKQLIKNGVSEEAIKKTITQLSGQLKEIVRTHNLSCATVMDQFIHKKELEEMRSDYMGRALLHMFDPYFPQDDTTGELLLTEPIPGMLPRQIAQGLLRAIKNSQGYDSIEEYELQCNSIAERYRSESDGLIDVDAYENDAEVKTITTELLNKFVANLAHKDRERQKSWLLGMIATAESFRHMHRDLTDAEMELLVDTLHTKYGDPANVSASRQNMGKI